MNVFCTKFFLLLITSIPFSLQAFGIWQCAGMLIPELNPLCWDACGFEVGAELLYLKRCGDSDRVNFTSNGISGPIVLHSDLLDPGWEWGYQLVGQVNLKGNKAVEIVWMPGICWNASEKVQDQNHQLYSIYSDFGQDPLGGFPYSDQSGEQSIAFESKLQTVEVNVKRLWGIFRGAFLYGYRYQCLHEDLKYQTTGLAESNWYRSSTEATNDMHGFQLGMNICFPCTSCFSFELFGKGAVYANCTQYELFATAGSASKELKQKESSTRTSWGIDAGAKLLYEWSMGSHFYIGYQYLSYRNIALAIDNFFKQPPLNTALQDKVLVNDSNLSYHGMSIGLHVIY